MFDPFSSIAAKIYGALAIGAIVVAGAQTLRIEGVLCRDTAAGVNSGPTAALHEARYSRCLVTGFKQRVADRDLKIEDLTVKLFAESAAHRQTKLDYRAAQAEAAKREQARLDRVKAEQQEITDEAVADYRRRLADARRRAEQLRVDATRAGERPAGPPGRERVPATGDAAGRTDEAAAHRGLPLAPLTTEERLIATEQALQLDALISWVERQSGLTFNRPTAPLHEAGK